jgi:hypothetical protein
LSWPKCEFERAKCEFEPAECDFSWPKCEFGRANCDFGAGRCEFERAKCDFSWPKCEFGAPDRDFQRAKCEFGAGQRDLSCPKCEFGAGQRDLSWTQCEFSEDLPNLGKALQQHPRAAQLPRQRGQAPADFYGITGIGRRRVSSLSRAARFVIHSSGTRRRLGRDPEGKVWRAGRNGGFDRGTGGAEECYNSAGHTHVSNAHCEPFDRDIVRLRFNPRLVNRLCRAGLEPETPAL